MPELTYRYRLYPTKQQERDIMRTCSCARFLYNKLLEDRTKHFRETMEWKKLDRGAYAVLPFLANIDPGALNWAQSSLEKAYRKFFHDHHTKPDRYRPECLVKAKGDPDYVLMDTDLVYYPRFKRKKTSKESYTTYIQNLTIQNGRIHLPRIGAVKIKYHRSLPEDGQQISCSVLKKPAGDYYLLVCMRLPEVEQKKELCEPMGIVFSRGKLAVRSDDVPVTFRHQDEETLRRIQKAYRTLKRRKPGSKRYEEQRRYLASLYERRVNQRRDDLHKAARQITNAGDTFYLQAPNVAAQLAYLSSPKDRAVLMDEAWWRFSQMLKYKAQMEGKRFWTVPRDFPVYSICSCCGHFMKGDAFGKWNCPECGAALLKDVNAAENLKRLAMKYIREQAELKK